MVIIARSTLQLQGASLIFRDSHNAGTGLQGIFANSLHIAANIAHYSASFASFFEPARVFHAVQSIGARQSEE